MITMFLTLFYVLISLLLLNLVIIIHELGHYSAARFFGFYAQEVSIGFGRLLFQSIDNHNTRWSLRLWPLGGYVDFYSHDVSSQSIRYASLGYFKQTCIILGGIIANLVTAFLILTLCFYSGFYDRRMIVMEVSPSSPAYQLGIRSGDQLLTINNNPCVNWEITQLAMILYHANAQEFTIEYSQDGETFKNSVSTGNWDTISHEHSILDRFGTTPIYDRYSLRIQSVLPNSPAQQHGLVSGDKIYSIDSIPLSNAEDLVKYIYARPYQTVTIRVEKSELEIVDINITLGAKGLIVPTGFLGARFFPSLSYDDIYVYHTYDLSTSVYLAGKTILYYLATSMFIIAYVITGKMSLSVFSGPIYIIAQTQQLLGYQQIILTLRWFAAINICLAFVNLLPLPVLDGGQWLLLTLEKLFHRPIPGNIKSWLYAICYGGLLGLVVTVSILDLQKVLLG
ncbi:MAG: RIP metalloprotease RseP [Pseudomonadota bacterium]|nr:RIP metalloprotease RseP [Pseudomonadota bacterium]